MDYIVKTITDWWIFAATLGAGVISGIVTLIAVKYTNKTTIELYERGRREERQKEAFVIPKTRFIKATLVSFAEQLIKKDIHDNVFVFSGADGFYFFDDYYYKLDIMLFSIRNDMGKNIKFIELSTSSEIKTKDDAIFHYSTKNYLDLLRSNEEILIKMISEEQFDAIMDELDRCNDVTLHFECIIKYLTEADQEIKFTHKRMIVFVPHPKGGKYGYNLITKESNDNYDVISPTTLSRIQKKSNYRNIQDRMATVRWSEKDEPKAPKELTESKGDESDI